MNKYYYLLDEHNRFFYISDTKREDIPELLEIETDMELSEIIPSYHGIINGNIAIIGQVQEEINLMEKNLKEVKINNLKKELDSTDYRIIKCYEAQLGNEEMPYDLQELLTQRKAWRDEINTLEFELTMLG
jgi:hypothetical protein